METITVFLSLATITSLVTFKSDSKDVICKDKKARNAKVKILVFGIIVYLSSQIYCILTHNPYPALLQFIVTILLSIPIISSNGNVLEAIRFVFKFKEKIK